MVSNYLYRFTSSEVFRHFFDPRRITAKGISAQQHTAMVITPSCMAKRNDGEEEREEERPLGMVAGHAVKAGDADRK